MSKFCPKCGCKNLDEASFCSECGNALPSMEELKERTNQDKNTGLNNDNAKGTVFGTSRIKKDDDVKFSQTYSNTNSSSSGTVFSSNTSQNSNSKANDNVVIDAEIEGPEPESDKDDNKNKIICCLVVGVLFLIALMAHF